MRIETTANDMRIYNELLADFVPEKIFDIHNHIWLKDHFNDKPVKAFSGDWSKVSADYFPYEDLLNMYRILLPEQQVTPLLFGNVLRNSDLEANNEYVSGMMREHSVPGLYVTVPEMSAEQLEAEVTKGGFIGLKPYPNFVPWNQDSTTATIFDFLPEHQLEAANKNGWIVMLHISRVERLRDPLNLAQLLVIEEQYPNIKLIVAHIGRAYSREDVGNAFEVLKLTKHMHFDFSGNTNAWVMMELLKGIDHKRVLYGSDMPITRIRMGRIYENGNYVNLFPPKLYSLDEHPRVRIVSESEGEKLTFFLYEQLLAFREAAEAVGLSRSQVEDVFYHNAIRLISK